MDTTTNSPLFISRLFQPLTKALASASHSHDCVYTDEAFLKGGVLRVISPVSSGRDFVQQFKHLFYIGLTVNAFFSALRSKRRLNLCSEVADAVLKEADLHLAKADPFAVHPELNSFAIYATDGHTHKASSHEDPIASIKRPVTHIYGLNLRTHTAKAITLCTPQIGKKKEHEISTLKRIKASSLRMNQPKGTKVIHAYDPAIVDYAFWNHLKQTKGVYILTLEKKNSALSVQGELPIEQEDPRNVGVISDEFVGPAHGGLLRRVVYCDPVTGKIYTFLTNEFTLPPGLLAFIYKSRWDVEKRYDVFKNKLSEKRAWGKSDEAKMNQAHFIAMTHNLMKIIEHDLREEEGVEDQMASKRRMKRAKEDAKISKAAGREPNPMVHSWQRATQMSLQVIRCFRHSLWNQVNWRDTVIALRPLTSNYLA